MELFAKVIGKYWLWLVLLGVGFCLAGRYEYLKHQVAKDAVTINNQKVTIKSQDHVIETAKTVAKIEEATQVAVQRDVKQTTQKHEAIQHKVAEQTRHIEQQYAGLPPTPANVISEVEEVSTARIDGLWEAYCTAQPNDTQCTPAS
jgi:hypothetical protein